MVERNYSNNNPDDSRDREPPHLTELGTGNITLWPTFK
jgi:hypothetical protein